MSYPNIGTASIAILYLWMSLYTFSGIFYSSLGSTYLSQDSCIKNDSYNNSNFKEGHKQNDFSSSNYTGHLAILLVIGFFFLLCFDFILTLNCIQPCQFCSVLAYKHWTNTEQHLKGQSISTWMFQGRKRCWRMFDSLSF